MYNRHLSERFRPLRPALKSLGNALQNELEALVQDLPFKVHDVSWRLKGEESLAKKLARPDRTYRDLTDIKDLIGLRVVTYFEDHIESVARLMEQHFRVDFEHSVDKRWAKDPQSFGYRSLHYICYVQEGSALFAWEGARLPFEIQIRSILQHAWAEMEHDLGYKFPEAIPQPVRRRFSRLAGLLELADEEFVSLRKMMEAYEKEVDAGGLIRAPSQSLDLVSLKSLLEDSEVRALEELLAMSLGKPYVDTVFYPDYLIRLFKAADMQDTGAILLSLRQFGGYAVGFMEAYFAFTEEAWGFHGRDFEAFQRGYSLFLLAHALALRQLPSSSGRTERMTRFFYELDYPDNQDEAERVARLFVNHCSRGMNTL